MLLSYYHREGGEAVPVLGLPGCVMYAKRTIFDILLPRILADDPISKEEIASLGSRRTVSGVSDLYVPELRIWKSVV